MKFFGINLFNREPKVLWDFAQFGLVKGDMARTYGMIMNEASQPRDPDAKPQPEKKKITPKELFTMSALNDRTLTIQTDEKYIQEKISDCEEKLNFIPKMKKNKRGNGFMESPGGRDFEYGRQEILSVIERLNNRRQIASFAGILKKYPHTTNKLLNSILTENRYLQFNPVAAFIPDLPREATNAMKEYNKTCERLFGKKTNFYIVGDAQDFEEKNKRRDPILLAQSPFGFFWNILGAWDEEIVYLDEL